MNTPARPRVVQMRRKPQFGQWPNRPQFAAPIDPMDAVYVARARSILYGVVDADGITAKHARDIVAWHERQRIAALPPSRWRRLLDFIPGMRPPTRRPT